MAYVEQAIDKARNMAETNFELGCDHAARGLVKDAAFRFRITLWLKPQHQMAWYNLGCCYLSLGKTAEAYAAFRKSLALNPQHEETKFMLATMDGVRLPKEQLPLTMPLTLVVNHFDALAPTYDDEQLNALGYRGHTAMQQWVVNLLDRHRADYSLLELGCGTGLCGPLLRPVALRLVGVDVSRGMAEFAAGLQDPAGRRIYDEIDRMDMRNYLAAQTAEIYDVVFSANSLNFVGDLAPIFEGVAKILRPGGFFAFSTDRWGQEGYQLVPALGRFAHSPSYLDQLAAKVGLQPVKSEELDVYPGSRVLHAAYRKS